MQMTEEQTVKRLYDAGTHLCVQDADDAVVMGVNKLESDGFRHTDDNGDVLISGFASAQFYNELRDSAYLRKNDVEEMETAQVHNVRFQGASSLPDGTAVLIHDKALVPNSAAAMMPFVVRHEQGIVVLKSTA